MSLSSIGFNVNRRIFFSNKKELQYFFASGVKFKKVAEQFGGNLSWVTVVSYKSVFYVISNTHTKMIKFESVLN